MTDQLGDRMKGYEDAYRIYLPRRLPVIIRVDGRGFHSYTAGLNKFATFDDRLRHLMVKIAVALCNEIQGAKLAYLQSDEVSVLVHNYKKLNSEPWVGNNLQKIVSLASGIASHIFTLCAIETGLPGAEFDARAFVLPEAEVCNYFIWRQQDATRNSIQMLARSLYSHRDLHCRNNSDLQEMCVQRGHDWNDLAIKWRRGSCVVKTAYGWTVDDVIPVFTQDRSYMEKHLAVETEDEA